LNAACASIALCALIALLLLTLWNVVAWPRVGRAGDAPATSVSVLIPARNEERNLPECLRALAGQGQALAEILIYDDHSTDRTAAVIARQVATDGRVRTIPTRELPSDWLGKPFACAQLAEHARADWLLFLDADARMAPGGVARLIEEASRRKLTFLSCWPGLELRGFWERLLMPLLNFVVFTIYPAPLAEMRPDPSLGLAHGACVLVHRRTYEKVGGHGRVRRELFEDTRLAREWRAAGHRGLCLDGQDVVRVRMYDSFRSIWDGFQKNFFPAFQRRASFWIFMAAHAGLFLAPFPLVLVSAGDPRAQVRWGAAVACVLGIRAALSLRFRHPWSSVLLHPFAEAILIARGLSSWWRCAIGHGVEWKGRTYHPSGAGGESAAREGEPRDET
jgi:chlorobactene glucosyltransferase